MQSYKDLAISAPFGTPLLGSPCLELPIDLTEPLLGLPHGLEFPPDK